jgi:hypothetical protein
MLRSWGKAFVEATAALVTLLVADNILDFTHSPYYQPATYAGFGVVVLIGVYSRKKKWGMRFMNMSTRTSTWILGVIAIVMLQFPEKQVSFFDGLQLSSYNLLIAFSVFLLILLAWPFFLVADLPRELDVRKRIPTIFNPKYVVHPDSRLSRIVEVLRDYW